MLGSSPLRARSDAPGPRLTSSMAAYLPDPAPLEYVPSGSRPAALLHDVRPGTTEHERLGELAFLLDDETVTDIVMTVAGVAIDRGAGLERAGEVGVDVGEYARDLIALGGRHIDEANPVADVQIGSLRVHAVLPPIAAHGPIITIRVSPQRAPTFSDLEQSGAIPPAVATALRELVANRESFIITGATGAGKSTLLAALLSLASPLVHVVTVEEVAELRPCGPVHTALITRQANLEGRGRIELGELVRAALRMRPDWLVVGECRGRELPEFLGALNTGHAGAGTVHADGLVQLPARLEALGRLAGMPPASVHALAGAGLAWGIHVRRRGNQREVHSVGALGLRRGRLQVDIVAGAA